jgi:His-Xaa-Ser system protein HxsD
MQALPHRVRFSSQAYSLDTIKRAAYRFTGQFAFNFHPEQDSIICEMAPLSHGNAPDMDAALQAFTNEVLDQDLRRTIADETAAMRNLILAHVFSRTGLQSSE